MADFGAFQPEAQVQAPSISGAPSPVEAIARAALNPRGHPRAAVIPIPQQLDSDLTAVWLLTTAYLVFFMQVVPSQRLALP